jgi:Ca2+-binding EF-hand superfamily protein
VEPKSKGYIDFNGFLNLLFIGERCLQPETIAKNLFYEFDIDNDGHIGYDEFKDMMADLYSDHIKNIDQKIRKEFRSVDENDSGRISLKEMASILKAHLEN